MNTAVKSRKIVMLVGLVAAGVVGSILVSAPQATAETTKPEADLSRGEHLYQSRCASCHGAQGTGDGPTARNLQPKPTNFTAGHFKLRSTATGQPPTDGDLYRTISKGIPGTGMIGWSGLSVSDRWQLVYYVKSVAGVTESGKSVEVPEPAPVTEEILSEGERLYGLLGCVQCHGAEGGGDGVAANTLVDYAERVIYPRDLTKSAQFKGGATSRDIYRTLHTGFDGTPMPSYAEVLSPEDTWALTHYIRSLRIDAPTPEVVASENSRTTEARLALALADLEGMKADVAAQNQKVAAAEDKAAAADQTASEALALADETASNFAIEDAKKAELAKKREERAKRNAAAKKRRNEKKAKAGKSKPAAAPVASRKADAKKFFRTRCGACHGVSGAGNGPAAAGLNPKPRDFTASSWKKSTSKRKIGKVITDGGPAAGFSPLMPAFPELQSDPELLKALVKYVQGL